VKTLVAMSGGVDSSVAAWLLAEAGEELLGVSMQLWDARSQGGETSRCCSPADFRDARLVASGAGFPYYVLDYEEAFRTRVVEPFVNEYRSGRTPNPCVECNRHLKFGALLDTAERLGAGRVATGHYARLDTDPASGRVRLKRARDRGKDQSYFLCMLGARALERALFPIGNLSKEEVRAAARRAGLGVAEKPESQDLCFMGSQDRRALLARLSGGDLESAGEVVSTDGRLLGTHPGLALFTVGQRRGLAGVPRGPWYVVRLDPAANRVVVGREPEQYSSSLQAVEVSWVSGEPPRRAVTAQVRIRHAHQPAEATLEPCGGDEVRVRFRTPQRAVTPGQVAAFYDEDTVLGGGRIAASTPAVA
jgi:tRNA-specific 2-thiouridylase